MQTLENNVVRFVQTLRAMGIVVGFAETIDALEAVKQIDLLNKAQFNAALKATLVKDAADTQLFELAFNAFFDEVSLRQQQLEARQDHLDNREKAKKDLEFQHQTLELEDQYLDLFTQLPDEAQNQVREFVRKTSEGKNVTEKFKPIVENLVKQALDYHRSRMKNPNLMPIEYTGDEEIDAVLHQVEIEGKDLFHRDMAEISEHDYLDTLVLIRKLARRLATRISRRYEHSSKMKKVDIRRSIRAGIRYGGTLMDLKYRQKKIQKPEIVLLCDISGSMIKYAQFTLQFMSGLVEILPKMHAFVFADTLETVLLKNFSVEQITQAKNWGEGTNLNVALRSLSEKHRPQIKPDTVLVILSDTKTMQAELAAQSLKQLKRVIKDIVWLNPMPGSRWEKHSTVKLFQKYSTMWECSTLAHLSKALRKQFG